MLSSKSVVVSGYQGIYLETSKVLNFSVFKQICYRVEASVYCNYNMYNLVYDDTPPEGYHSLKKEVILVQTDTLGMWDIYVDGILDIALTTIPLDLQEKIKNIEPELHLTCSIAGLSTNVLNIVKTVNIGANINEFVERTLFDIMTAKPVDIPAQDVTKCTIDS